MDSQPAIGTFDFSPQLDQAEIENRCARESFTWGPQALWLLCGLRGEDLRRGGGEQHTGLGDLQRRKRRSHRQEASGENEILCAPKAE
jgi:hypothetical protein